MGELFRCDIRDIDLNKPLLRSNVGVLLASGDNLANRFGANVYRQNEAVDLTGCIVTGYFIRPTGETVIIPGTVEGNKAFVDLSLACYTSEGSFCLAIKISSEDAEVVNTLRVVDGCIRMTQTGSLVDPDEVIMPLEELLAMIDGIEQASQTAVTAAEEAKAAAAKLGWYNVQQHGILTGNTSAVNATAWNKLLQTVQDAGGGTIYFPAGTYSMGAVTTVVKNGNLRIIGDGCATKINRWGNTPFMTIVGSSIHHTTPAHVKDVTIENMTLHTSKGYTSSLEPYIDAECVDYLRICNVKFSGNGTHIRCREVFDSKIYATDFENGGRRWPESGVASDSISYTALNESDFTPCIIMESETTSYRQPGYETTGLQLEVTNQILFIQCRFEGYTGGAMLINSCNGIRVTDCKFESTYSRVPHIVIAGTSFSASSLANCVFGVSSVTLDGVNTTAVPVVFSYTTWINNDFNVTFGILANSSGKSKAADLIRIATADTDQFGGNRIIAHVSSKMVESDVQSVAAGYHVVNLVNQPARLNTNGNETKAFIAELGGFSISPYPT